MVTGHEQAGHAARVVSTAEDALGVLDLVDAEPDMRDLAELLAAVGVAWASSARFPTSLIEAFRWSEVCVIAERIATRWRSEVLADARISAKPVKPVKPPIGQVLSFTRNRHDT